MTDAIIRYRDLCVSWIAQPLTIDYDLYCIRIVCILDEFNQSSRIPPDEQLAELAKQDEYRL